MRDPTQVHHPHTRLKIVPVHAPHQSTTLTACKRRIQDSGGKQKPNFKPDQGSSRIHSLLSGSSSYDPYHSELPYTDNSKSGLTNPSPHCGNLIRDTTSAQYKQTPAPDTPSEPCQEHYDPAGVPRPSLLRSENLDRSATCSPGFRNNPALARDLHSTTEPPR